jgi:hypothetical protein
LEEQVKPTSYPFDPETGADFDPEFVAKINCELDGIISDCEPDDGWWDHCQKVRAHWLAKLDDGLWDEDIPWSSVPRFEYEEVMRDAIADTIERAYHAGRRSALGEENAYWKPPAAPEQNQRHNDNPTAGSGGKVEGVLDGF